MAINLSSAVMPLAFGLAGAALGASALFWLMGAAVAAGSVAARQVGAAQPALPSRWRLAAPTRVAQKRMPPGAGAAAAGAVGRLRASARGSARAVAGARRSTTGAAARY